MSSIEIPFDVLGFGSVMLVLVMLVHGAGLDLIVSYYNGRSKTLRDRGWHPRLATYIFAVTILLVLFLHILEICIWGVAVYKTGLIPDFRNSMYFCANTYVTIGYGQMLLPHSWRELGPLMAISGLFTFAWTTGQLFTIVGYHHDLVEELAASRKKKKSPKAKQDGGAGESPHVDEVSKEEWEAATLSAEERQALRNEIEQKLRRLHDAEWAEIEIRRESEPARPQSSSTI